MNDSDTTARRQPAPLVGGESEFTPAAWLAFVYENEQRLLDRLFGLSPHNRRSGFYAGENQRHAPAIVVRAYVERQEPNHPILRLVRGGAHA